MPARTERYPYLDGEVEELVSLYLLARETRRQDPIGSPKRAAGDQFTRKIAEIRDRPLEHGQDRYTYYELANPLLIPKRSTGEIVPMDQRQLRLYLGRRKLEKHPDSQRSYGDEDGRVVEVRPSYRTDDHFSCRYVNDDGEEVFCERTEDNSYWMDLKDKQGNVTGRLDYCKRHQRIAAAKVPSKLAKRKSPLPTQAKDKPKPAAVKGAKAKAAKTTRKKVA